MSKADKSGKSDRYPSPSPSASPAAGASDMDAKTMTIVARIILSALLAGALGWLAFDPGVYWDAVVWLEKAAVPSLAVAVLIAVAGALISMTLPFFMDLGMAGAALVGHWTVRPARMVLGMVLSALAGRRIGEEARDLLGMVLVVAWGILGARGFQDMDTAKSRTYGPEFAARQAAMAEAAKKQEAEYAKRVEQDREQRIAEEAQRASQLQARQEQTAAQIYAPPANAPRQDARAMPATTAGAGNQGAAPQRADENVAAWFR